MQLISCRYGIRDSEWAQIRTLLAVGLPVKEVAELCNLKSRWSVYQAKANDVPPSQRQQQGAKKSLVTSIKSRRASVKRLIKKTRVFTAKRIMFKPGRPRKDGTPRGSYTVTKKVSKLMYPSPAAVARALTVSDPAKRVSASTVRRDLEKMNMKAYCRPNVPALTPSDVTARLRFARRMLRNPKRWFEKLIFTDEKWFDCNDSGHRFQWCERGRHKQEIAGKSMTQGGPAVFVWGAIAFSWRVLVFVEYDGKGMNQTHYIQQCLPALAKKKKNLTEHLLMQDGATLHWTPAVLETLNKMKLKPLADWPAHSPDMNPIEHMWSRLSRAVSDRGPYGVEELQQYIKEEFDAIDTAEVQKLVLSFRNRCCDVVKAGGESLK
jgi:hypothetical protein